MKTSRRFIIGGRLFKTGISVLITAVICHLLNWPPMFAVITAIVTIEPTAADSIKKAFVRFPAAAIGAALSVLFTFLFGDSPLSYMFVAVGTIFACHKLKLHDGMLVATLTGVAMITTVHDHYVSSFFIRLGTTATGIIVSTLVNIFILPPKYTQAISDGTHNISFKIGEILAQKTELEHSVRESDLQIEFDKVVEDIEKMKKLCEYQKEEWRFHPSTHDHIRVNFYDQKKLMLLQQITYHIGNFIYLPSSHLTMASEKAENLKSALQTLSKILSDRDYFISKEDRLLFAELTKRFYRHQPHKSMDLHSIEPQAISAEISMLYELLSIYDLTVELNHIQTQEKHRQHTADPKVPLYSNEV